jgi:hypothetical protein
MDRQFQFSLRRFFSTVTLIAVGVGLLGYLFSGAGSNGLLFAVDWLLGGVCIGAGILNPFRKPILGAFLGGLTQVVLAFIFLMSFHGIC